MLTLVLVLLAIGRRKIQIDESMKEVIYRLYEEEMDREEILK